MPPRRVPLLVLAFIGAQALGGAGPRAAELVELVPEPADLAAAPKAKKAKKAAPPPPPRPVAKAGKAKVTPKPVKAKGGVLTIFGDSYSDLGRYRWANWARQLEADGTVAGLRGYARSGAVASGRGGSSFAQQIKAWGGAGFGSGDAALVYFGYNDIPRAGPLTASEAGLKAGVQALVKAGATTGGSRLLIVLPHDVGSTPKFNRDPKLRAAHRAETMAWNRFLAGVARGTKGALAVDLFTTFDKVAQDPRAYGFTNVTTADKKNAGRTALYADPYHFGPAGHAVIRKAVAAVLSRRTAAVQTAALGQAARRQRAQGTAQAMAAGLALAGTEDAGLLAFPLHAAGTPMEDAAPDAAGLAPAPGADAGEGGLGLAYALGPGTTLGLAIARHDVAATDELEGIHTRTTLAAETVSLHLQHRLGPLALTTRLGYSRDRHELASRDALSGRHDRAAFDGSTLELAQRVGHAWHGPGLTLTPWAELGHARQAVDGFTLKSPYLSDQAYAPATLSDTQGSLGLDVALDPIPLGERARLALHGGLAYTHGLHREDPRLRVEEAAFGLVEEEVIERPALRRAALTLGASLAFARGLALEGDLLLEHEAGTGAQGAAWLGLAWRF